LFIAKLNIANDSYIRVLSGTGIVDRNPEHILYYILSLSP
jgi:hypothetical protein